MEWPLSLIIFDPLPNDFEFSSFIKSIFGVSSIFIVISGLKVHKRILSFVKKNNGRHVDRIVVFQSTVNCFLIPISLSWLVGLQWLGEMKHYISPQGCYVGTFLGKFFRTIDFFFHSYLVSLKVEVPRVTTFSAPYGVHEFLFLLLFFDVLGVFKYDDRVANISLGYIAKINFFQKGRSK